MSKKIDMTNERIGIDHIDRYLKNVLDNKEKTLFEERLKNDAEFNELFLFLKTLKESVRYSVLKEKADLLKEYESYLKNKKPGKNGKLKILYLAVSIAAIFLILIFFVPDMMSFKNKKRPISQYFEAYPAHVLKRSSKQDISKLKQKAYAYYGIADFKKASLLLAELCDSGDKESCFYTGVALLGSGNPSKALVFFEIENLPFDQSTIFWYRGLCYWELGKKQKAKSIWKNIDKTSPYYNKAKNIKN